MLLILDKNTSLGIETLGPGRTASPAPAVRPGIDARSTLPKIL